MDSQVRCGDQPRVAWLLIRLLGWQQTVILILFRLAVSADLTRKKSACCGQPGEVCVQCWLCGVQALQAGGYPLISSTDARNKRVPWTLKVTKKVAAAAEAAHATSECPRSHW